MSPTDTAPAPGVAPFRARAAWCLFDFANSAFPTIALTAFGGRYFQKVIVGDAGVDVGPFHLSGTSAWGLTVSFAMLLVVLTAPVVGAYADRTSSKRALLTGYTLLCVAATAGLALVGPGQVFAAFALFVVANFAFEGAYVFYNAFLPELTTSDRLGRLSGYGWGLGYVGGLLALMLVLPLLPKEFDPAHVGRAPLIFLVVAGWYLVFSVPAMLFLKDAPRVGAAPAAPATRGGVVGSAFTGLLTTLRHARLFPFVVLFLIASFLYTDGITTVIDFTGVYTGEVLAFTPKDTIVLFLVLNVIAAPGALVFGILVDRFGARRSIAVTLVLWMLVVVGSMLAQTKAQFWPVAGLAAVVMGATQSATRAFMARIAPRARMTEFMGLLTLSGKASAVFGPTIYGLVADAAARPGHPGFGHRVAIGVIGSFFVVALVVLLRVDEARAVAQARAADAEPEVI